MDNPEHYRVLYLASARAGAVAEAFGGLATWSREMFVVPALARGVRVLGVYALDDEVPVLDLDDPRALLDLGLRPSQVVTRDRDVTRSWALRVFQGGRHAGIRWWSYYDPRWYSYGIWDLRRPRVIEVEPLSIDVPAVMEAADVLGRPIAK